MATIKIYTRTNSDKLATLNLRYVEGTKIKIRIALPVKIIPSFWDENNQRINDKIIGKKELSLKDALKIGDELHKLSDKIKLERSLLREDPSKEWLQTIINEFYGKSEPVPQVENLNDYIFRFIVEATAGKRLCFSGQTKKVYSAGTLRSLRDFQRSFDMYQGISINRKYGHEKNQSKHRENKVKMPYKPLNWQDITIDWYNEFVKYFYKRNCSPNYIGKHLKTFKAILRQAKEEGMPVNPEVERKAFKVISAPAENIYLTDEDLQKLRKLDLSSRKHLEVTRDVFLVGCYTAQRYSDYSRINKGNIKEVAGNKFIELIQQKTGEKCIIPVMAECDEILKKYDYTLPRTHEQKINERIKTIACEAEIKETIYYEQSRGGVTIKKKVPKYELIKTHTARRTGCTLMYLAGIPVIDIMKMSGHRTEREFMKYIKVTKEQTAINLANHPYFKGNTLKIAR